MHLSTLLFSAALLVLGVDAEPQTITGKLGNAVRVTDNPEGAVYMARLPMIPGKPQGSITATTAAGMGVNFAIDFTDLPSEGGEFCKFSSCACLEAY
jgi:hypothetical protein